MSEHSRMKSRTMPWVLAILLSAISFVAGAQERIGPLFPDIPGYQTLTCDLHTHTVFSDGSVWPTIRVQEAWRNGLDALSITDHIEYLPFKEDVRPEFNRPYEIAKPEADRMHLMLIRGSEITRDEPHGHFNAVFLDDCAPLDTPEQKDAVRIAYEQGAFVFWNHPEWKRKDGKAWSDIQQEYFDLGWMHGLEVWNGHSYYKNAHQWALDHNLTLMGCSDIHTPIDDRYRYHEGEHRTMTLAFVKEKTPEALKEALFDRRTVVFAQNTLVGREEWAKPLFEAAVEIQTNKVTLQGRNPFFVPIRNNSAMTFELEADGRIQGLSFPGSLTLPAGKTVLMRLQGSGVPKDSEIIALPYRVTNIWLAPDTPLKTSFDLDLTFKE
jgi:3',5'-nucleoside bisphosphate phosphatase